MLRRQFILGFAALAAALVHRATVATPQSRANAEPTGPAAPRRQAPPL